MTPTRVVVLGPQRMAPSLLEAAASLGVADGPFVTITAGWEEREAVDKELMDHLKGRARNLGLYGRAEKIYRGDKALRRAVRERHNHARTLQELYQLRLRHAAAAVRELLAREARAGEEELLAAEREDAFAALRALDAEHLERMAALRAAFDARWKPLERDDIGHQREELRGIVADAPCVCVAGGHVAVLLERMRLFGVDALFDQRTVIAWSGGAMALSRRVVLFHDSPPQGPGDAEVFDYGLGVAPELVPLPHASRRLHLGDAARVELFARRFGPDLCLVLDQNDRAEWDGAAWTVATGSRRLLPTGQVEEMVTP